MRTLSSRDVARVLSALRELYSHRDLGEMRQALLDVLGKLIPADITAYNEFRLKANKVTALVNPRSSRIMALVPAFEAHLHQHPQINFYQRTKDGRPHRISDFLSDRRFQALGLYQEFYRLVDIRRQLACFITEPGELEIGLSLSRDGSDFSGRDRAVLSLLRPHFGQAYQNVLAFTEAQRRAAVLAESLDAAGQAVVVLTAEERLAWITPLGVRLLERYFPGAMTASSRLPEPLSRWLRQQQAGFESGQVLAQGRQPFAASLSDSRLIVRLGGGDRPTGYRLLLTEEPTRRPPAALKTLGLTGREAEVLHWMAEGKTNPEIGIILCLSHRTIHKHVEHILEKLGVENRTAAVRVAMDAK